MVERRGLRSRIGGALERSRVVALIGPRQCGKTTLARQMVPPSSVNYFDLEDPVDLQRLEQPMFALRELRGLVVIDEIQRRSELFPILRVLCDRDPLPARFLVLGSASPTLLRQASESLAGRLEVVEMGGFTLAEVGADAQAALWRRGGLPLSYLAATESDSAAWRASFVRTFLERDVPQLGIRIPAAGLHRFWSMLAHYHGQVWNAAEAARSLGVNESTARRYLDLLTGTFMVRQLPPWHANLGKRQVKSPRVYFRDTGLLHHLLGIRSERDVLVHPKSGASWEGFVIEQVLARVQPDQAYFWATHGGAELDLLLVDGDRRIGVECKRVDAPRVSRSMRIAMDDLEFQRILVLYPGPRAYPIDDRIDAVPVSTLADEGAGPWRDIVER